MRARGLMLVAALLGVVAGRGCGFGPSDSFTGRRIGDGVAPYTDQGEVRVCAGNDRLGPPTSLPGGYCDKATPGAPCDADADCRSRERCVCGVCTVQFCSSSSECGFGRVCSFVDNRCDRPCASRADCSQGESCINQVCRSGPCTMDTQCQTGERCGTATPRRCVVDPCDTDAACSMFPGRTCKVQRRPRTAREPTVMIDPRFERPYVMFLSLDEVGGLTAIYRADSDDGKSFRLDPGDRAVLSPGAGDGGKVDAPSVVRAADGTLTMYFEVGGVSIARATSPDGRTWTRSGSSILTASTSWEGARVGAPAAALASTGHTLLFYEGGTAAGLGLAVAPAGSSSFTRAGSDGRVLAPGQVNDPVLWRGVDAVASPFADVVPGARDNNQVRVWFAAHGEESSAAKKLGVLTPVPPNFSIGFASATFTAGRLSALVPHAWNPVFDRIEGFLVHPSELSPAVVEAPEGERYLLYYGRAAVDGTSYANLGVAENP